MEKQGMVRRKRLFRTGLLIFLPLFFLPKGLLFSQTGETGVEGKTAGEEIPPPLEVRLETSSASPTVNTPWVINVLVNHPRSSEVTVRPPRFPPSLVLERVRTETRLIQRESPDAPAPAAQNTAPTGAAETSETAPRNERWTRVEFLFTPRRAGTVSLEPFEAAVSDRRALTGEVSVRIREEPQTVRRYEPRFRWMGTPSVPRGEQGELLLELSGWDPQKDAPRGIFQGRTPLNAILEENPPAAAGEGFYRYTIFIIPLEESGILLEPFSFHSGGFTLNIPEVKIPVLPARVVIGPASPPAEIEKAADAFPSDEIAAPLLPFPEYREKIFPLFQGWYIRVVTDVRSLWENGRRAEALAEIRRNERDSPPGPFLVPLRREMEMSLGLDFTENESWRPLKLPLPAWLTLGLLILFAVFFLLVFRLRPGFHRNFIPRNGPEAKSVTSRRRGGFRAVIVTLLLAGAAFIFLDEGLNNFFKGNFLIERLVSPGKAAILERTAAYRVPDLKSAVNARFGEGQPVTLGGYRGDWYYAESVDGRSGWVPRETVITY